MVESVIEKAAKEQAEIASTSPEVLADDLTVMDDNGIIKTAGAPGGFSAPSPKKKEAAQTAVIAEPTIADLQAQILWLKQQQNAVVEPAQPPVQPPQQPQPPVQQPIQEVAQVELPDGASMTGKTVFFGDASPSEPTPPPQPPQQVAPQQPIPQQNVQMPPLQQSPQPVQPSPQPQPEQPAQPNAGQQNLIQTGDNYAYVAQSHLFPNEMALILDNISTKELDQYSWMSAYLSKVFPEAMPEAHPGLLLRFALDNLLFDIRKETAEFTICAGCGTKFSIMDLNCPNCNNTNRCPACKRRHGPNKYQ